MKTNRYTGTDIQSITLYKDGYAWEATVRIEGVAYVASYVGARLGIELAAPECPSRYRAEHFEAVRIFAIAKVLALSPAWHRRHEKLHGVRSLREAVRRAALDRLVALEGQAA